LYETSIPGFALAVRLGDGAGGIDTGRPLEELGRLLLPDADAHVVQDVHQRVDPPEVEATAEVAHGGRVGDGARAERIEEAGVVAIAWVRGVTSTAAQLS
jgi:hypothetical protein